jgi:hypothetical protein
MDLWHVQDYCFNLLKFVAFVVATDQSGLFGLIDRLKTVVTINSEPRQEPEMQEVAGLLGRWCVGTEGSAC